MQIVRLPPGITDYILHLRSLLYLPSKVEIIKWVPIFVSEM